jgi:hypothetical protein
MEVRITDARHHFPKPHKKLLLLLKQTKELVDIWFAFAKLVVTRYPVGAF